MGRAGGHGGASCCLLLAGAQKCPLCQRNTASSTLLLSSTHPTNPIQLCCWHVPHVDQCSTFVLGVLAAVRGIPFRWEHGGSWCGVCDGESCFVRAVPPPVFSIALCWSCPSPILRQQSIPCYHPFLMSGAHSSGLGQQNGNIFPGRTNALNKPSAHLPRERTDLQTVRESK